MKVDFKPTRKGVGRYFLIFSVIFCIGLFLKFVVEPNLIGGDLPAFQATIGVLFWIGLIGLVVGLVFVILFVTVV